MVAGGEPRPCGACLFFGIGHSNRILDGVMDPTLGSVFGAVVFVLPRALSPVPVGRFC